MNAVVRIAHPVDVLYGYGVSLACARDGQLFADKLHGLFAGDTRVLSTYRFAIGGYSWQLLGRSRLSSAAAQWHFQNPVIRDPGGDLPAGTLLLSLNRKIAGALHDDLRIQAFPGRTVHIRFTLHLDADFADLFEVKDQAIPPRLNVLRVVEPGCLELIYEHLGFRRGLRIRFSCSGGQAVFIGTQVHFELELDRGAEWTCCLEAIPLIDGETVEFVGDPHSPDVPLPGHAAGPSIRADQLLETPFKRGRSDLRSLAMPQPGHQPHLAAGVPWFFTLFGRDQLITALMAGLDGSWSAEGALASLAPFQAKKHDDWRDAEPGKLPHELRKGELAFRGSIPHTPYYGTHDAPSLYCLTLWQAWRWTGNSGLLESYLEAARQCLRWCEEFGDRDGDGLQEYATRSPRGYYNQSWKDSGDAIVDEHGCIAQLPLATVEMQGYLFAAYLATSELLDISGEKTEAERLRRAAQDLRVRVEERFWIDDKNFYALALDRDKRPVTSISSNPGHLLWCGLPCPEHAKLLAERFMKPDFFSGWGLRTLSSRNPAFNPLSYQLGSVWPFDTALAAAGLWRYGSREQAGILLRSILEAAMAFEEERLPELFCGTDRAAGGPIPYEKANSPQAWSSAVPLLAAQLFLGILADAPRGRCFISPCLPEWLTYLELRGLTIGQGKLDIRIVRQGNETLIDELNAERIEVIRGTAEAPLWAEPLKLRQW